MSRIGSVVGEAKRSKSEGFTVTRCDVVDVPSMTRTWNSLSEILSTSIFVDTTLAAWCSDYALVKLYQSIARTNKVMAAYIQSRSAIYAATENATRATGVTINSSRPS
jgi:hypothetical protein